VDYLVEEVLQHQPESLRSFLLQTSILTRLNGSLCDAVTGQNGGKERLATLQRGNFFLIPLDDKRHWYRYHHLFADVLLVNLMTEQPDLVSTLHKRASEWYAQNGSVYDAIRHAMAANDYSRAADLLELNIKELLQRRQEAAVLNWFMELPEEQVQYRPVLCNWYAGSLLTSGKMDGVDYWLSAAEKWLDFTANTEEKPESLTTKMIVNNEAEFRRLPGAIAIHRAGQALMLGNVDDTMKFARRVLELARNEDDFLCGAASALLGLALWTSGDLETAHQMFAEGMTNLQKIGYITDVIGGSVTLADIRITQGQLRAAMSIYERGLQLATKQGMPILRGAADMHVGMSELYREGNDLHSAMQHLEKCKELGELNGLPKNPYRWRVAMAGIREVQGNLQEALVLLDEAEPLYAGDFSPNVRPIQALKARVWIKQGELEKALAWAREQKLSIEESPSYLREFEQITFVRILLYQYQRDHSDRVLHDAMELLESLLRAADEGGRMGSVIEILILQALAYQIQRETHAALMSLERALKLAEPEGYMRIFLSEGSNMAKLIREVDARRILPGYTRKLLSAFETDRQGMDKETYPSTSLESSSLIEPLSQRELDILRLFKTELSGPEIAQEYVIALSTVRTHTKSIYSKLNVNSRRGAVKRAIELGLI
jgi:LuxR family maltose regulon positive regulatory protein